MTPEADGLWLVYNFSHVDPEWDRPLADLKNHIPVGWL
jgi:hypothetical protein